MRFSLEQTVPGTVEAVLAALLDPAFITSLGELPMLHAPEVLSQERDGTIVVQRVRHRFAGTLPPAVTRVIDPKKVTWVDQTTYDLAAGRAEFHIIPDTYGNKLRCHGTYVFTARDGMTVRRSEGELKVSVPLLGRAVERAIVSGVLEHIEREGDLLATWLEVKP